MEFIFYTDWSPCDFSVTPSKSSKDGRSRVSTQELDSLLSSLPTCVTRDGADEIAVNFCYMNSKPSRKKLIRTLCDVPKASLQLLPFYTRIAAILSQVFPDVAAGMLRELPYLANG